MSLLSLPTISEVKDLVFRKKTNPDLLGLSALLPDSFFEIKHADKKVLGVTIIAFAMGMYRP